MSLEHILLGMLDTAPASGYELKREFGQGARYFWSAELSQIYPTLERMERRGWVASRREPSDKGPPRRVYRRTKAGTRELKRWLEMEPILGTERFAYIGQLIFMGQLGDLRRTLRFVQRLRKRLADFHELLASAEQGQNGPNRRAPRNLGVQEFHDWLCVRMGMASLKAKIDCCDQAVLAIRQRLKRGAKPQEESYF